MKQIKVVHYLNQFFAQIGGEEKADIPPESKSGPVGPGMAFKGAFGDAAEIVATVACGDSYFNENPDVALAAILDMIASFEPDIVVCGPAFNAGRYGVACGAVATGVREKLNIPAITGMYVENPGVDLYKQSVHIVSTKDNAAGMRDAVALMVPLALKLARGEEIGTAAEEGYIPMGIRKNFFDKKRIPSGRRYASQKNGRRTVRNRISDAGLRPGGSQSGRQGYLEGENRSRYVGRHRAERQSGSD